MDIDSSFSEGSFNNSEDPKNYLGKILNEVEEVDGTITGK